MLAQSLTVSSEMCIRDRTTTMPAMESTVKKIKESDFADKVKVMVGGAPIDEKFAVQIGADGYAVDAASAAEKAKELVS